MKFYFAGHTTFGNRGCEALIRSTIGLIREQSPTATFLVPSSDETLDRRQWPAATSLGVRFVAAPRFPATIKWWNRMVRLVPPMERLLVPHYSVDAEVAEAIEGCDAMIMSGGDVLSLDYGLASLYDWTGLAENALVRRKPVAVWAASIGPFMSKPHVERFMTSHLGRYSGITVRETATRQYLASLGLDAPLVADPAFTLVPEAFADADSLTAGADGCLGFNVSPLIRTYRKDDESRRNLDREIITFVRDIVSTTSIDVLLIPHVGPLDGSAWNSDHEYMRSLFADVPDFDRRIRLAPPGLNAAQLKHLISLCRFFIGARTHATIGAFSTGVPTASIAYSVKAKGINQDLFGHLDFVLETPSVSSNTLWEKFEEIRRRESEIRSTLKARIPAVKASSRKAAEHLLTALR
jgi:colanic acid/amylovoran biosynthesis protein